MLSELVGKKGEVGMELPRSLQKMKIIGVQERVRRKIHRDDHLWAVLEDGDQHGGLLGVDTCLQA